mmetsp:Transcript_1176/g.4746  ORF Transcript_1176/g.4746 Transcript_1176/m.4746 type:complete len:225 (+) Transcript_1176:1967-2641(+)
MVLEEPLVPPGRRARNRRDDVKEEGDGAKDVEEQPVNSPAVHARDDIFVEDEFLDTIVGDDLGTFVVDVDIDQIHRPADRVHDRGPREGVECHLPCRENGHDHSHIDVIDQHHEARPQHRVRRERVEGSHRHRQLSDCYPPRYILNELPVFCRLLLLIVCDDHGPCAHPFARNVHLPPHGLSLLRRERRNILEAIPQRWRGGRNEGRKWRVKSRFRWGSEMAYP